MASPIPRAAIASLTLAAATVDRAGLPRGSESLGANTSWPTLTTSPPESTQLKSLDQKRWSASALTSLMVHGLLLAIAVLLAMVLSPDPWVPEEFDGLVAWMPAASAPDRLDSVLPVIAVGPDNHDSHQKREAEDFELAYANGFLAPSALPASDELPEGLDPDSWQTDTDAAEAPPAGNNPATIAERPAPRRPGGKKPPRERKTGVAMADQFSGRSSAQRKQLLHKFGGTKQSEDAVARGLDWLKRHQRPDRSWSLDHNHFPECTCTEPGLLAGCDYAATSLALLSFLGQGHTHRDEGRYQAVVDRGINYLKLRGLETKSGWDYRGQSMGPAPFYSHGLCTLALSEALAMTRDEELYPCVEGAVKFASETQHSGGGWRYVPGMPGDTSVVGWILMSLKSAEASRVMPAEKTFAGITRFLDQVDSPKTGFYSYLPQGRNQPTPSMTAVGSLCRMYLGWDQNRASLKLGVKELARRGPDPHDIYYNYYATQVLHHWGGAEWERWNEVLRDQLIESQERRGCPDGSWSVVDPVRNVADPHARVAGRHFQTTLSIMTLEVYYRHLPIYNHDLAPLTDDALAE